MLATSKNSYFKVITTYKPPVLITLHFNYHPCWHSGNNQSVGSSALVGSRWLWPGNSTFLEVASMMVTWYVVAFLRTAMEVPVQKKSFICDSDSG